MAWSRRQIRQCRDTFHTLLAHMQRTPPLWEVLGGCRFFCCWWGLELYSLKRCDMWPHSSQLIHTNSWHTHTHIHTRFLSRCFSPGWSELFISLSTSAARREMLSLGHYKYPQAVENVLTDTGDKRGPACRCLSAVVWWCSEWPTFPSPRYFILDLMKSWITNPRPNRIELFCLIRYIRWLKYTEIPQLSPSNIFKTYF